MSRPSAVAVGLLLAVNLAPTVGAVDPLEVALDSGIVRGIEAGATREWRGIPARGCTDRRPALAQTDTG